MAGSLTVREIITRYKFKSDTRAIKRAGRALGTLKTAAKTGAIAIAGFAAAGAKLITSVAKSSDKIAKSSKQLEINAQFLQAMGHAAQLSGTSISAVEMGIRRMSAAALEASRGSKAYTESFDEMGVSVRDASGKLKDNETLLLETFEGLSRLEDSSRRVALAQKLFGRSGVQLIPMLKNGSAGLREMLNEADELGIVLEDSALKQAEDFQDSMTRMRARIGGVIARVATGLMPAVTRLVDRMQAWFRANEKQIGQGLEKFLSALPGIFEKIGQFIAFVSRNWRILAGIVAAFAGAKVVGMVHALAGGFAFMGKTVGGVIAAFAGGFAVGTALDKWLGLSDLISDKLVQIGERARKIRTEQHASQTRDLRLQQTAQKLMELRRRGVTSVERSGGRGRLQLDRAGIAQALKDQAANLGLSGSGAQSQISQILGQLQGATPAGSSGSKSVNVGAPQITVNVPPGTQATQAQRVAEAAGSATRSSMRSAIGDVAR